MSVEKRKTKNGQTRWTVRYRNGGVNCRKTFDSRRDADAFAAQVRLATRAGTLQQLDGGRVVLAEFGERWWADYVQVRLATATRHGYAQVWNTHVLPYLGERRLRDITPYVVESWRADLERAGVGAPTVRKAMTVLQSCLQRGVVWGELRANPCREVRKPAGKRQGVVKPLIPAEINRMLDFLRRNGKHRDVALVSVLGFAGLRPSEALGLEWEHIREHTILVEQSVSFGELKATKTGKTRSVELRPELASELQEWRLRSGRREGLIFPGVASKPWSREAQKSWERRWFKEAARSIGRPDARPYTLRHSFASRLIHEGRSIVEIAAQLGHAPTMTLDTYAHVFADAGSSSHNPRSQTAF